jgi:hypothetical protein
MAIADVNEYNNGFTFTIPVTGCGGSTGGGSAGGGSAGGGSVDLPAPVASAEASTAASPGQTPSDGPIGTTDTTGAGQQAAAPEVAGLPAAPGRMTLLLALAGAGALLLAASGGVVWGAAATRG